MREIFIFMKGLQTSWTAVTVMVASLTIWWPHGLVLTVIIKVTAIFVPQVKVTLVTGH